jgi:steroid delta-isomerase-like uncharacterized protein
MGNNAEILGRRFFEEVLGTGNWSVGEEIIDANVVLHHPSSPEPVQGYEAVKGMLSAFRAGFPDLHMVVEDAFGNGDKAVIRWHMTGTHTGNLFGIPATGNQVDIAGMSIVDVKDGKIVEDWVSEDTMGLMQQIGVVPTLG